ncbi:MAG: Na/Pi cotransporter family protein [Oscillospiraceae bacterium]|nr:Na/Pi cotransporter family protein [Oscillospiraceae bacterium]
MSIANFVSLLGGVALFLFGMTLMGEGLKKVAGNKLELVLYRLSGTPIKGVLLGTGVTAVIQSSSATSVMVVGFVNSGMMKLGQAISVIQGALIGTSITGWIICLSSVEGTGWVSLFSTSTLSAVVAVVGIILRMFSKRSADQHVGDILLGFAVLMFGMQAMSGAVAPLKQSEAFIQLLVTFSNPVIGILVGALFTSVIQSSSAAVGILQALSMTGAVTFATAYPIILGIAIGAAVPVLLSAIGAKADGRRAAFSYLLIELLGVVACALIYYIADAIFGLGINSWVVNPVRIATVNSLFRLATAVLLVPFNRQIRGLVTLLVKESKGEKSINRELDRLEERFLQHPALAIEQSRLTVNSMARAAEGNLKAAVKLMSDYSEEDRQRIEQTEELVDLYEDRLGTYLVRITARELDAKQNESVSKYLHTLSDFERISDHAMNIAEAAQEIHSKKLRFSEDARRELAVLTGAMLEILELAVSAFVESDIEKAYVVEPLEERIDILCDEMKIRHIDRIQQGLCSLSQGFVFNDILTNFERVADHCSNLAIAMIELHGDSYDTHSYVINLKELHSHNFDALYEHYTEKYSI